MVLINARPTVEEAFSDMAIKGFVEIRGEIAGDAGGEPGN